MDVGSEAHVVGQIPADMVGIVVDHDLVASPVPISDDVVIVCGVVPL